MCNDMWTTTYDIVCCRRWLWYFWKKKNCSIFRL